MAQFPDVLGTVDGTLILILAPKENECVQKRVPLPQYTGCCRPREEVYNVFIPAVSYSFINLKHVMRIFKNYIHSSQAEYKYYNFVFVLRQCMISQYVYWNFIRQVLYI
jgi:hypothetical protein